MYVSNRTAVLTSQVLYAGTFGVTLLAYGQKDMARSAFGSQTCYQPREWSVCTPHASWLHLLQASL
jgi:hypothetical protein